MYSDAPNDGAGTANAAVAVPVHENVHWVVRLLLSLATIAVATLMTVDGAQQFRSWLVLAYFCWVPGVATVRWMRPLTPIATYALALPISLAINAAIATTAIWVHAFHPFAMLFIAAAGSLYAMWQPKPRQRVAVEEHPRQSIREWMAEAATVETLLPLALVVVALGLWWITLKITNVSNMGSFGLIPRLPIIYFVAVALIAISFVFALTRREKRSWLLAMHIVVLIFILHGTSPSLFPEPRYPWVYKHFGVVDYLQTHGSVNTSLDIYQNWPGFFAGAAWLSELMGIAVTDYAAWSQVFFNLTYFIELSFIYQALGIGHRVRWLAMFLFFTGNWVGQDYFSPQGFSLLLALTIFGIVIAWLRSGFGGPIAWIVRKLLPIQKTNKTPLKDGVANTIGWHAMELKPWADNAGARRAPLLISLGLFAVMVVAHQLSPYLVLAAIFALTLLGGVSPWWFIGGVGAIAGLYLGIHYNFIVSHFGPLFGGNPFHNAKTTNAATGASSADVSFYADTTRALAISLWVLGIIGFIRRVKNGQRDLTTGALAVSPFVILGGQSYGGEAIFRVYLFSLPWFSLLAAYAILPRRVSVSKKFVVSRCLVLCTALGLFLCSYFSLETIYEVKPAEVSAMDHFYNTAPAGSTFFSGGQGLPARLDGKYGDFINDPSLELYPELTHKVLTAADVPLVDKIVDSYNPSAPAEYIAFSRAAVIYAHGYGLMPDGSLPNLQAALSKDPGWKLFSDNGDVTIYQRVK